MRRTVRRGAGAALHAVGLLAGCAVSPPPPSPDPIEGGTRLEGELGGTGPSEAAFCVSQDVPLSHVLLVSDGAAVRPATGAERATGAPDYAVTLRRSRAGTTWLRQVGEAEPYAAAAVADRLDRALARCALALGGEP